MVWFMAHTVGLGRAHIVNKLIDLTCVLIKIFLQICFSIFGRLIILDLNLFFKILIFFWQNDFWLLFLLSGLFSLFYDVLISSETNDFKVNMKTIKFSCRYQYWSLQTNIDNYHQPAVFICAFWIIYETFTLIQSKNSNSSLV